jgi:hypothetical protein
VIFSVMHEDGQREMTDSETTHSTQRKLVGRNTQRNMVLCYFDCFLIVSLLSVLQVPPVSLLFRFCHSFS